MPANLVTSRDGTAIAYFRSGGGPPLVLVHGATADHTRWAPLLPALEQQFSVIAIDRRGRGHSNDASSYAIEREFEDVAAVVDAIGEPVFLLGHSYGAVCSLEATRLTNNVKKLVLYEPPIPTGMRFYSPDIIEHVAALLAQGDREGVVMTFFREVVRAPETELRMITSLPNWPARVATAHTISREMRIDSSYAFCPAAFLEMNVPTLLLLGGDSPPIMKAATEAVHRAISTSRIDVLPGQQHTAMNTAPELFLDKVTGFLLP